MEAEREERRNGGLQVGGWGSGLQSLVTAQRRQRVLSEPAHACVSISLPPSQPLIPSGNHTRGTAAPQPRLCFCHRVCLSLRFGASGRVCVGCVGVTCQACLCASLLGGLWVHVLFDI